MVTEEICLFSCRRLLMAQLRRSVGCLSLSIRKKGQRGFCVLHVRLVCGGSEGSDKI